MRFAHRLRLTSPDATSVDEDDFRTFVSRDHPAEAVRVILDCQSNRAEA